MLIDEHVLRHLQRNMLLNSYRTAWVHFQLTSQGLYVYVAGLLVKARMIQAIGTDTNNMGFG